MRSKEGSRPTVSSQTTLPPARPLSAPRADNTAAKPDQFRTDIQALRAIAVGLVLIYHLWPNRVTGGFAGVDVFFVISGFLISTHLLNRVPRTLGDLGAFWGRRVRRLLPAALLVLGVTLVATRIVAPDTRWRDTALDAIAAALYAQNWRLAQTAVDYLAADNVASPIQHYWSLSVEEQFYLFWPILILALAAFARARGISTKVTVLGGLLVVVLGSLGYSIYATWAEPARAYFVTPTRIWELGVGALVAVGIQLIAEMRLSGRPGIRATNRLRIIAAWAGLAAIGITAFRYTAATPFPGWRAMLPVLGAAIVIFAAAPQSKFSPTSVLNNRPVQWLGDISYSVYLWHWPIISLLPFVSGGKLGLLDKLVVLVVSLILGTLTKRYVEDVFRFGRAVPTLRRTYAIGAAAMAIVVALGAIQLGELRIRSAAAEAALQKAISGDNPCFGAAALERGANCAPTSYQDLLPRPADAPKDKSDAYSDSCWVYPPFPTVKSCTFGDKDSTVSIALLGNSHAGHWLPALQELAKQQHWKITTYLASECTPSTTPVEWDAPAKQSGCLRWADNVQKEIIEGDFDLVVTSNRNGHVAVGTSRTDSQEAWVAGYRDYLKAFDEAKVNVLVIHDNPFPGKSIPDCLSANQDQLSSCDGTRDKWLPKDAQFAAAQELDSPRIHSVNLTESFCQEQTCPAVIGGVIVYFDGSHITATYARTLAPSLKDPMIKALP